MAKMRLAARAHLGKNPDMKQFNIQYTDYIDQCTYSRGSIMNWIKIATIDQLDEDESLALEIQGKQLALHRTDGDFFVSDNVCTHQYALLSDGFLEDGCIECPLHQAKFDLRTGKAQCAPASVDIQVYPVKTEGQDILVSL